MEQHLGNLMARGIVTMARDLLYAKRDYYSDDRIASVTDLTRIIRTRSILINVDHHISPVDTRFGYLHCSTIKVRDVGETNVFCLQMHDDNKYSSDYVGTIILLQDEVDNLLTFLENDNPNRYIVLTTTPQYQVQSEIITYDEAVEMVERNEERMIDWGFIYDTEQRAWINESDGYWFTYEIIAENQQTVRSEYPGGKIIN